MKKNFRAHEKKFVCARKKNSVRTKKYFRTYKKIFSYVQKKIFVRTKIQTFTEEGLSPSI
ncbi:hypothetical protein HQ39_03770 [Porphyromonas sp. COT-108 OH2963]|nr:hypothetical protein HQ39_03770 [Porphyromonas sp. COT-108 OH2963]